MTPPVRPSSIPLLAALLALCLAIALSSFLASPAHAQSVDKPVITIRADQDTVVWGGEITFTLSRTGDTSGALTVRVRTWDARHPEVSATLRDHQVTFNPGSRAATLTVTAPVDTVSEIGSYITAEILFATNGPYLAGDPFVAGVNVADDDLPIVSIDVSQKMRYEGEYVGFRLWRSGDLSDTLDISVEVSQTTNVIAGDVPRTEHRTFLRHIPFQTVGFRALHGDGREPDGSLTLRILPSDDYRIDPDKSTATVTIIDNDASTVWIAADQTSVAEGQNATFTLMREEDNPEQIVVRVVTWEPTHPDASSPTDLENNPTRQEHEVTFIALAHTATLTAAVQLDGVAETYDLIRAEVLPSSDGSYVPWVAFIRAEIVVTDTAPAVTIKADQASVAEGKEATFTLTRTGPTGTALAVSVSVSDPGSFLRGNHWEPDPNLPVSAMFEAGSETAKISLRTKDDRRDIPDNDLTVSVTAGDGYQLGEAGSANATVTDNDVAPELELSVDRTTIVEGETLNLTVRRHGETVNPVEVSLAYGFRGQLRIIHTGIDSHEVAFSISAVADDNDLDEADWVFEATILPFPSESYAHAESEYWTVRGDRSVTVTVADDDLPVVGVEADADSYLELRYGKMRITRVGQTDRDLVVNARVSQAGHDIDPIYAHLVGDRTHTIEASSETENVLFLLGADDGDEADGAITLELLPGNGYVVDPERASATFRVIDVDPTPVMSVSGASDTSVSESVGAVDFTVTLSTISRVSPPSRQTVTVDYATSDDTAGADDGDYTETSGVLTFQPGETSGTISVPVNDDNEAEDDERFTLTLSNPSNAMFPDGQTSVTVTGTIEDDEPVISIAARNADVTEGEPAVFEISRTGSTGAELTVALYILAYGTSVLTEAEPFWQDFPRVTFPSGADAVTWERATADDDVDAPEGEVLASLSPFVTTGRRTYWLGEQSLARVAVTAVSSVHTEGQDAEFRLTREGVASYPLTVNVSVTGGDGFITGTLPTTVTFAQGDFTHTLSLATENDAEVDEHDQVEAAITEGSDYEVGDPGSASLTFFDSERSYPSVSIRADSGVVTEGEDVVFTLTRSEYGLAESLTVRVKVIETKSSLRTFSPYSTLSDTRNVDVVFEAGSGTAALVRPTVDELVNDGNSTVAAEIRLGQYSIRPYPGRAEVWVRDDDIPTVTTEHETEVRLEDFPDHTPFTILRTGDTTSALPITWVHYVDARWPEEVLEPAYLEAIRQDRIPDTISGGIGSFQPGVSRNTFVQEPQGVGPLGSTAYLEVLPIYCGTEVPGDCAYRPQYQVGTPKSITIEVLNRDLGVRVEANQESVTEGEPATFTLRRYGGTRNSRVRSLTVRVQVTQNGDFIDGMPPQTVTFVGSSGEELHGGTPDGEQSKTVSIPTDDDLVDEANGAITLTILAPDPGLFGTLEHSYETFGTETFLEGSSWTNVATVEVTDDDEVGLEISDAEANEADGSIEFTVTMPESALEVSVDWATAPHSDGQYPATEGVDYVSASGALTFAPGETSKTVTVTVLDDDVKEEHETFVVGLSNPSGASLLDPTATGAITNDDVTQIISFTSNATGVVEGQDVVFFLERKNWVDNIGSQDIPRGRLVVDLNISQAGDFIGSPAPATAVFEAGVWTTTVTVPTVDDAQFEPDGSVSLQFRLFPGDLGLGGTQAMTATVWDNDMPVSISGTNLEESRGLLYFPVSLEEPAVRPVTVDVATVDGTATSHGVVTETDLGADFQAKSETLTFAVGEQEKRFYVTLVADRIAEPTETFTVELSNPSNNAWLKDPTATGTIRDSNDTVIARLIPPTQTQVPEDSDHPVRFVVEFGHGETLANEQQMEVDWEVIPGTATHVEDYLEASGTIIVPPGHVYGVFEVHLVDDALFEERLESFTVTLTGGKRVEIDTDHKSAEIRIRDTDSIGVAVFANAMTVTEGQNAAFTVQLAGSASTAPVEVNYEVLGTATADEDYTAPSGMLTIPVGQRSGSITIATLTDGLLDPDETLEVRLTDAASQGRVLARKAPSATITILDDVTTSVAVSPGATAGEVPGGTPTEGAIAAAEATEGEDLQFTVTLSLPTDAPVNVQWTTQPYQGDPSPDGAATPNVDYTASNGTVTIPAGTTYGTITVPTTEDVVAEGNELFTVMLTGASRGAGPDTAEDVDLGVFFVVGRILDDDDPPTGLTLSVAPDTVAEDAGETALTVTATLNGANTLPADTLVSVTLAGGTADENDYSATTVALNIAAGQISATGTLNLTPVDDAISEANETVQVTATADGLTVTPAEVTITDNDIRPTGVTLTVTPDSVGEGAGATDLMVTAVFADGSPLSVDTEVTLSVEGTALPVDGDNQNTGTTTAASIDDFTVGAGTSEDTTGDMNGDGDGTLPEDDMELITLTIPAGAMQGTATMTLTTVDDAIAESDETAQVRGATASGLPVAPAKLTITDNDREPSGIELSVTPAQVDESDGTADLQITATLTGGAARTVDTLVSLSLHDLTAMASEDYTMPSSVTLTIPAGSLTGNQALTLTVLDDDLHEGEEELAVRGANADPGLPVTGMRVTIADDDAAPTGIVLSLDQDRVSEDAGLQRLTVTATLEGNVKRTVETRVTLTTSHQTATEADYSSLPSELMIGSGKAAGTATLLLVPVDDAIDESDETFEVRGATYEPGLTVFAQHVIITDDDHAGVTVSPTALTVVEGQSNAYTVVLDSEPTSNVIVAVSGHAGTDLSLSGQTLTNDELTFTPDNWNQPQTVTVTADQDDDAAADAAVTLSHAVSGAVEYAAVSAGDIPSVTVTIDEDDAAGVTLSTDALTVIEGQSNAYTVVLTTQPTSNVTVTISGHTGSDLSLSAETLTFTSVNWNIAQTVTVSAGQDDDASADPAVTLSHAVTGAVEYAAVSAGDIPSVTVTIDEDDAAGVTLSTDALTVIEGQSNAYTVVLTTQPTSGVTVTISGHSGSDVSLGGPTLSAETLTFTSVNWNVAQTVTVSADQDDDAAADPTVILSHAVSGTGEYAAVSAGDIPSVTVTIDEDDEAGVSIDPTALTVIEGQSNAYTVVLTTQPSADVTLTISGHAGTDLSLSGQTLTNDELTFTSVNWNVAQTVTVSAGQDDDAAADPTVILSHAVSGTGEYATVTADSVTVTIDEDDAAGVSVDPTALTVVEGQSNAYTVVLDTQPSADVTLTISGHAGTDLSLSGQTLTNDELTFTSVNWNVAQTVTVSAGQDDDAAADPTVTLSHAVSGAVEYAAVSAGDIPSVTVTIDEDDSAGVSIDPTVLTVVEGQSNAYTVVLTTQPTSDVTVTISGHAGTDLSLSGQTLTNDELTFTPENWNQPQTVTVTADQDDDAAADPTVTLSHAVTGAGEYAAVSAGDIPGVTVTIDEDDAAGVTLSTDALTVIEGQSNAYTVVLTTQPSADVSVTVTGHAGTDLSLSGQTLTNDELTFTSVNWNITQTVTVTADQDDDAAADPAVTLSHAVSGAVEYAAVSAGDIPGVTVTITDNDAAGVSVNPTALTVIEGQSNIYSVVLDTQPTADVTVTISGHTGSDLSLSAEALTFTPDNWSVAQSVTVTASQDDDAAADAAVTLSHAVSGAVEYAAVSAGDIPSVTVTIDEDDAAGVSVDPTALTVVEGQSNAYTVVLDSEPTSNVIVAVSGHAGTDLSLSGQTLTNDELTFTSVNWNVAQTVTVSAGQDDDAAADAAVTLSHAVSGAVEYAAVSAGDIPSVTVTIDEDDAAGVSVDPTALTVIEGQSNTYTVVLTTQPSADVTVTVTGHAGTDVSLSGQSLTNNELTFTPDNWNQPQTVTVTAGNVTADAEVILGHAFSGGDYDSLTADVRVTVLALVPNQLTIQVGVTVSEQTLSVPEGGSNTYEVVLGEEPTGDVTITVTVEDSANNDVSTDEASLVFTPGNWNQPQSVTVRAAHDDDARQDPTVSISHGIRGANYDSFTVPGVAVTITDDDHAGVTVSPTALTVIEGQSNAYAVVLDTQPTADVTVTISGHSGSDVSLGGPTLSAEALTFTSVNWNQPQSVTVSAGQDDDAAADPTVTLSHAVSGAVEYAAVSAGDIPSVTVTIDEDDSAGVSIDPTVLTVVEGQSNAYTVVLTTQPTSDVTVTISGHAGTDLSLSGQTLTNDELTFTPENWNQPQTVTVTADQDDDAAADPTVTLSHAVTGAGEYAAVSAGDIPGVTVTIDEDDAAGVTLSTDALTVIEGQSNAYTVVLTTQPSADVSVTVTGHAGTDLSLSGQTLTNDELTFTSVNWNITQTVTVTADQDDDAAADPTVTLSHAVSGTVEYAAVSAGDIPSVTVTIDEDDAAGVSVNPTALTVIEGSTASYTVVLDTQPGADVIVTISGHSGSDVSLGGPTLSAETLTFTSANWNQPQTVTVSADQDDDAAADPAVTLSHAVSGAVEYAAVSAGDIPSVTVTIDEDDAAGVSVSPTALTVVEGSTASYTVVLDTQPSADVIVAFSGHAGTDLSLSGQTLTNDELTFTSVNWNVAQTVTVIADQDDDAAADAAVTLSHAISGAVEYAAVSAEDIPGVTVTIDEDDAAGVSVNPTALTVVEGQSNAYTVVLDSEPTSNVTVTISGHTGSDLSLSAEALTFTSVNWNQPQSVTVAAGQDDDAAADPTVTLSHAVSGAVEYAAVSAGDIPSVTVTIDEDDAAGVSVDPTALTVMEGQSNAYTVVLDSEPTSNVIVTISGHAGSDLSLSAETLTFTSVNWNQPQTVTVSADQDDDAAADPTVTLSHAVSGAVEYAAVSAGDIPSVTVTIDEDDAAEASVDPTLDEDRVVSVSFEKEVHYTIEGASGGAGVKVILSAPLDREVTIPVTVLSQSTASVGEYTLHDTGTRSIQGLTFSPGSTLGAVFVKPIPDMEDEDVETVVLGFGQLPNGVSAGHPSQSTVEIRDLVRVSFAESTYTATEGGEEAMVTVLLNEPLSYRVTIPLTVEGGNGATEDDWSGVPETVTFNPRETSTTFTVTAIDDTVEDDGETVVIGFGTFDTDTLLVVAPATATITIMNVESDQEGTPDNCDAVWCATAVLTKRNYEDDPPLLGWTFSGEFPEASLSDNDFMYKGTDYVIGSINVLPQDVNAERSRFYIWLDPGIVPVAHYLAWKLYIDGQEFPFSEAEHHQDFFLWRDTEFSKDRYRVPITLELRIEESTDTAPDSAMAQPQAANTPATGALIIRGTALAGQALTADLSGIEDEDGLTKAAFSYQWLFSEGDTNTEIEDATESTYPVRDEDVGKAIKVRVTFTDDSGNDETLVSHAVLATPLPNNRAAGAPTISGTARAGETLTAAISGISDADGMARASFGYWWLRVDGETETLIEEASGTSYELADADVGKTIRVRVKFNDDAGNLETLTSGPTATVAARPNSRATGTPTITGTARVGETLTASTSGIGDADGLDNAVFSYQWVRIDGNAESDIDGETGSTYTLDDADQGKTIRVRVSFDDDADNEETLTSAATAAVAAAPSPLTVSLENAATTHDGSAVFTFEIRFGEEFALSYKTLKFHALDVTGGEVLKAQRMDKPSNIRWLITLRPDSNGDVTIVLPVTEDCGVQGAICTEDGRKLANRLELTVAGPSG